MVHTHRPDVPLIGRVKIQAELRVPLIKGSKPSWGQHRPTTSCAERLVRCIARWQRAGYASAGSLGAMQTLAEVSYASDAIDAEEREFSLTARVVDVTGCRHAEFFHQLGEPELGFLLVCSADFPIAEGIPGVDLERTETIMQGADYCDFRYHLSPDELAAPPNATRDLKSAAPAGVGIPVFEDTGDRVTPRDSRACLTASVLSAWPPAQQRSSRAFGSLAAVVIRSSPASSRGRSPTPDSVSGCEHRSRLGPWRTRPRCRHDPR